MTVAAAHLPSSIGHAVLRAAATEAVLRNTTLVVIQVVDQAVDLDKADAHRAGLSDEVASVLAEAGLSEVDHTLRLITGTASDNNADAILGVATEEHAELLVIGARRRTPVGKFLLGSLTQNLILAAEVPVLVVKAPK